MEIIGNFYNSILSILVNDIMKNNCNNSDISETSDIIALLFHLYHLSHYYFNSRVGHHALLALELIISLLWQFKLHYSVQNMVDHYTLLFYAGFS